MIQLYYDNSGLVINKSAYPGFLYCSISSREHSREVYFLMQMHMKYITLSNLSQGLSLELRMIEKGKRISDNPSKKYDQKLACSQSTHFVV